MIDFLDIPDPRPISPQRAAADKALLLELVRTTGTGRDRHRIGRPVIVGTTLSIALVAGGSAAAYVLLPAKAASVHNSARCYSKISAVLSGWFPGTTMGIATTPASAPVDVAAHPVEACSAVWRIGLFTNPGGMLSNASYPVPTLAACVLPSGAAAVFPGGPNTCLELGLPPPSS